MRPWLQPTRRPLVALLFAVTTLAACERATAPEPASDPAATSRVTNAGVGHSGMVPTAIHATFGAADDAKPIVCAPAQAGISVPADKYVGTGNSTHAGKVAFTITFHSCTLVLPPGGPAAWIAQGHSTLRAANGDLMYTTFSMTQFVNGDFSLNSFLITGGTGRFANTTGALSGDGWIDSDALEGYFDFSGLMTRPNA